MKINKKINKLKSQIAEDKAKILRIKEEMSLLTLLKDIITEEEYIYYLLPLSLAQKELVNDIEYCEQELARFSHYENQPQ